MSVTKIDFTGAGVDVTVSQTGDKVNVNIPATPARVQTFTESGTWTKPSNISVVEVTLIGAGGGGGSGRRGVVNSTGGGGGASGGMVVHRFIASTLPNQAVVSCGAGGAGGGSVSTNNTDGNAGQAGGDTSFGDYLAGAGGGGGAGGIGPAVDRVTQSGAKVVCVAATRDGWFINAWRATGDGQIASITLGEDVVEGDYTLTCTAASPNAGTFQVVSPSGEVLDELTVGVAYVGTHLNLTLGDGATDFFVGDIITVTITRIKSVGNGAVRHVVIGPAVEIGNYTLTCTAESPNAGTFQVVPPTGEVLDDLTVGVAYTGDHINLTIADGDVDWAVRDTIVIQVSARVAYGGTSAHLHRGNVICMSGTTGGPATTACGVSISYFSNRDTGGSGGGGGGITNEPAATSGGGGGIGAIVAIIGNGGDGGGASLSAVGGDGGDGGVYGAGGGGGGASVNGYSSGAGGDGAGGFCMVVSW